VAEWSDSPIIAQEVGSLTLSHSVSVAQWSVEVLTANNGDSCHVMVLGRLFSQVPGPTQPSIPPGSINEDQLQLGRLGQVWFSSFADKRVGVQVKL